MDLLWIILWAAVCGTIAALIGPRKGYTLGAAFTLGAIFGIFLAAFTLGAISGIFGAVLTLGFIIGIFGVAHVGTRKGA